MFRYKQDISVKAAVLKALQEIKAGDKMLGFGICGNVKYKVPPYMTMQVSELLHEIFDRWDEFSGDHKYPISISGKGFALRQYQQQRERGSCWNKSYNYVKARYRLLDFCITELEQDPDLVSK